MMGQHAGIGAVTAAELSCPIQHGVVCDRWYGVVNNAVVKTVGAGKDSATERQDSGQDSDSVRQPSKQH